jgi:hypothetical protein
MHMKTPTNGQLKRTVRNLKRAIRKQERKIEARINMTREIEDLSFRLTELRNPYPYPTVEAE